MQQQALYHTSNRYRQIERRVEGGNREQGAGGREGRGSYYSPKQLKERPTSITCSQTHGRCQERDSQGGNRVRGMKDM